MSAKRRVVAISFATPEYYLSAHRSLRSLKKLFPECETRLWTRRQLGSSYLKEHAYILEQSRGAGLWAWKSEIVKRTLAELNDNDDLIYTDAGILFHSINKFELQENLKNQGMMVFALKDIIENEWTNRYVATALNASPAHLKQKQIMAGISFYRRSQDVLNLVATWRNRCHQADLITDMHTQQNENHRYDQSLFSLTCKQSGIVPCDDPTNHGTDRDGWNIDITRKSSRTIRILKRYISNVY